MTIDPMTIVAALLTATTIYLLITTRSLRFDLEQLYDHAEELTEATNQLTDVIATAFNEYGKDNGDK